MTDSSKVAASSQVNEDDDDDNEPRNTRAGFRLGSKNRPLHSVRKEKNSGVSSDEDTTSSSLLPMPDTLKQMRDDLKRIVSDTGEPGDNSLTCSVKENTIDAADSLHHLKRKYSIKSGASVTMKMNTANLILDDILSGNHLSDGARADLNLQPIYIREPNFREEKVQESDTCSLVESIITTKHCHHGKLAPVVHEKQNQVIGSCHLAHGHSACRIHKKEHRAVCACASFYPTDLQVLGRRGEEKQRKLSLLEKIHNLHLRCRIQSVYKIVQKNNPFSSRNRRDESSGTEQGIPHNCQNDAVNMKKYQKNQCNVKTCTGNHYPRRMVFDLVESSDASQSDEKSTLHGEEEGNCVCPLEMKCTCPDWVPAQCTCCDPPKFIPPESDSYSVKSETPQGQTSVKVNELVQTDAQLASVHAMRKEIKVEFTNPENSGSACKSANSPNFEPGKKSGIDRSLNFDHRIRTSSERETDTDCHDWKKHCFKERKLIERTDIYYFDHGNSSYYRTTDNHPVRYTECLVERTDEYATKFWGEIFGVIEIGVAFLISFILQLYRFFFTSIIRSLTVGLLQVFSDYFFKPLLTIIFNGIIQPFLILAYNIATSTRDLCLPISQTFGFFMKEVANLFKSCRLIEINHGHGKLPACHCGSKV